MEGSYRSNGITGISTRRIDGALLPLGDVSGREAVSAVMGNVAYDLPLPDFGLPLQPYIGAGLGYSRIHFGNAGGNAIGRFLLPDNNIFRGPEEASFGGADALAYQAIAGVSSPLPILPGLDVTLEYRFFGKARADIPVTRIVMNGDLVNGVTPFNRTRNGFQVHDNSLLVGLRYAFGAV